MDAKERATKIIRAKNAPWVLDHHLAIVNSFDWDMLIDLIAAQIEEAEREADRRNKDAIAVVVRLSREDAYKEGYNTAKEQAEKVVVDYRTAEKYEVGHGFMTDLDTIALRIRAMQPEEKK